MVGLKVVFNRFCWICPQLSVQNAKSSKVTHVNVHYCPNYVRNQKQLSVLLLVRVLLQYRDEKRLKGESLSQGGCQIDEEGISWR